MANDSPLKREGMFASYSSVAGGGDGVAVSLRAPSPWASEMCDGSNTPSLPGLLDGRNALLARLLSKHCRSMGDVDTLEESREPCKLARNELWSSSQGDLQAQMIISQLQTPPTSNSSTIYDARLGGSSPSSVVSGGCLLSNDFQADVKRLRRDSTLLNFHRGQKYSEASITLPLPYQIAVNSSGLPFLQPNMDKPRMIGDSGPFTAEQWVELNQQTLILKLIKEGVSPPHSLLDPIRRSVAARNRWTVGSNGGGYPGAGVSIPGMQIAVMDAEPGRCRRTDGKKWRCARAAVPDQKYCDRHMHRGRHRPKKGSDAGRGSANSTGATVVSSTAQVRDTNHDNLKSQSITVAGLSHRRGGAEIESFTPGALGSALRSLPTFNQLHS